MHFINKKKIKTHIFTLYVNFQQKLKILKQLPPVVRQINYPAKKQNERQNELKLELF